MIDYYALTFLFGYLVGLFIYWLLTPKNETPKSYFDEWNTAVKEWGETIEEYKKVKELAVKRGEQSVELYKIIYEYRDFLPAEATDEIIEYTKKYYPLIYVEQEKKYNGLELVH